MIGSIYIHVPFCSKKCYYCHFYVIPDKEQFKALYMEALKKEWEYKKNILSDCRSIYFGGGTPSLLGSDNISEILSWLPSAPEITLEANPESMGHFPGINRLSIGVQAFQDHHLKRLGRTHSAQKAVEAIQSSEIENMSIDLMYDLPNQTVKEWEQSLEMAVKLPIKHISLYNLTIEPHTAFYKWRKKLKLPSADDSLQMLEMAIERLPFERYELSAFAKPGFESQHNLGYWSGRPFIGLGPSAYSYIDGARFRNPAHFHKWREDVTNRDSYEKLSPDASRRELLAVGLRLIKGIESDIDVQNLIEAGLVKREGRLVRLTRRGQLLHDTVAEEIIEV
ncbi:MAG: Heme chaperone HemW [Chlamydiales bacterium]|nr:Heme chaperone HemW [Chlamydiales bacterium]MCH9636003.1 Heme chaperone HemW [Chlamydiales bacterium]MCH9703922.1 radical SAM family heme chaperone HemW [Chlamydiota bacterium]